MKIETVKLILPSKLVTNENILDFIKSESQAKFAGDLESTLKIIKRALLQSGAKTRHWLATGENPTELIVKACQEALAASNRKPEEIDLLIYASLHQEVLEPATANMVAYELGITHCECFDIKAACDGWMKAVKISNALFKTKAHKTAMIVNAEFPMLPNFAIYPKLFGLSSIKELDWRLPAFTLGEGVSATILTANASRWLSSFSSRNDLADLCTATPPWCGQHHFSSKRIAPDGPGLFTSYGSELFKEGLPEVIKLFWKLAIPADAVDILFTHASSKKDWAKAAQAIGLSNKIFDIYEKCGNIVSASIPGAMAMALDSGVLCRKDRTMLLGASAGMSFSAYYFEF